jgi:hypothetical protein
MIKDALDDIIDRMQRVLDFRDGTGHLPPEFWGPDGKTLAQDIQTIVRRLKELEEKAPDARNPF